MMNTDIVVVGIVIGGPILAWLVKSIVKETYSVGLKLAELKLKAKQAAIEEKMRSDELNAKILYMDDYGISPVQLNQLAEEVRQLREEVARLRQDTNGRIMG